MASLGLNELTKWLEIKKIIEDHLWTYFLAISANSECPGFI